jgi:hypothetical protein
LFEEVQARMRDPAFGEKLSERMWKMEGLFAEAKRNHGLSRARYRGRTKVQIQAYLSAIVQNLKRLVAALSFWFTIWRLSHARHTTPITRLARTPTYSTGPTEFRQNTIDNGTRNRSCAALLPDFQLIPRCRRRQIGPTGTNFGSGSFRLYAVARVEKGRGFVDLRGTASSPHA